MIFNIRQIIFYLFYASSICLSTSITSKTNLLLTSLHPRTYFSPHSSIENNIDCTSPELSDNTLQKPIVFEPIADLFHSTIDTDDVGKQSILLSTHDSTVIDKIHQNDVLSQLGHLQHEIHHEINYTIVKIISSLLPYVDTIGHKVLHMDDQIINYFINLDTISPELKKKIILSIIQISQDGDHFGAQVLQMYYDIVENLM